MSPATTDNYSAYEPPSPEETTGLGANSAVAALASVPPFDDDHSVLPSKLVPYRAAAATPLCAAMPLHHAKAQPAIHHAPPGNCALSEHQCNASSASAGPSHQPTRPSRQGHSPSSSRPASSLVVFGVRRRRLSAAVTAGRGLAPARQGDPTDRSGRTLRRPWQRASRRPRLGGRPPPAGLLRRVRLGDDDHAGAGAARRPCLPLEPRRDAGAGAHASGLSSGPPTCMAVGPRLKAPRWAVRARSCSGVCSSPRLEVWGRQEGR